MLSTLATTDVPNADAAAHCQKRRTTQAWTASVSELDLEKKLAVQLMHLASQFHASDYACAKFGAGGSAITYIPLSIHLPDHFKQLKERQASYADTEAWWLSGFQPQTTDHAAVASEHVLSLSHPAHPVTFTRASPNMQHELRSAMDSPLVPAGWLSGQLPLPKTSDTHPISVSAMIPQDLLSSISLHISLADSSSPTVFNIHPAFSLHRVIISPTSLIPPPVPPVPSYTHEPVPGLRPMSKATLQSTTPSTAHLQIWSRVSMKSALQSALSTNIQTTAPTSILSISPPKESSAPRIPPLAFDSMDLIGELFTTSHFDFDVRKPPISALRHERTYSVPTAAFPTAQMDPASGLQRLPNKRPHPNSPFTSAQALARRPKLVHFSSALPPYSPPATAKGAPQSASPALGNLLLSSCPGKKVRLTGPVRGRGAICRDLKQDLQRIRGSGVGCIVCCLDDEELKFLGAPWPEYSQTARELGLDVLRIPIPEGLAPASVEQFDAHLTRLISVYTLAGVPVLAHCRGGVGRAGLVACCWMLKLGLCGWVPTGENAEPASEDQVRRDTLEQVERVIGVVRRRRSLKAIETYEQVKFLVGYVDYLRGST
ncbi:protein-tyrosine phosphatase-like protein [Gloeopeniophorella convolvens]|nr:protein-tyrosine phosphatase-like protein [Gloeopeniophorella convolvens]